MTLTKDDIADSISSQCDLSKVKSTQIVESSLEFIKASLESGEDVMLSRFGKLSVNKKDARRGRNPATGKDLTLDARRVVTFRCSPVLRGKLNGKR
jgi:integration host factor subunit alpha